MSSTTTSLSLYQYRPLIFLREYVVVHRFNKSGSCNWQARARSSMDEKVAAHMKSSGGSTTTSWLSLVPSSKSGRRDRASALLLVPGMWTSLRL